MNGKFEEQIQQWFTHFHAHPEVSWKEHQTTQTIAEILDDMGVTYRRFEDVTGLIADIGDGDEVIAVRADIDALWQEVDGNWKANHSCGHDANISMVLGALLYIREQPIEKKIRFIFQPAEEKGQGAKKFLSLGVLDNVDYLFGVHVRPIQEIPDGTASAAICHGAVSAIKGTIQGEYAHAASPHLGKNCIEVGAAIVHGLQAIRLNPLIPYSVKMTRLHAGSETANIIPGKASFTLDLRAQTNETMHILKKKVTEVIRSVESIYGVSIQFKVHEGLVAAIVNEESYDLMERAIIDVLGKKKLKPRITTPGGEDFHFYSLHKPTIKATMLGLGCDLSPGLHHPNMTFNPEMIHTGINILTKTILNTAQAVQNNNGN